MGKHNFQFNWFDVPEKKRTMAEAMLFQFSQTEKFSRSELARLQLANLQQLMRHACKHVPYYRARTYSHISNWDEWRRLPLLQRSDVQKHAQALHADTDVSPREGKSFPKSSSGSTGTPVQVLVTERANVYWQAITLRDHLWQQRDFSQTLATIKHLGDEKTAPPGTPSKYWGPSTSRLFNTGRSVTISSSTDISAQYQWLCDLQPGYLITYPSLLRALAEENLASDTPLELLGLSTMGENLSPETRQFAQRSFACKIADIYSCQEIGYLALQCPRHDHYHIQAETTLLEVLDDNNQPCAPGTMGRVVVTHLHNYAMPLIRYEIGDYAIAGGDCDCGIKLPVLQRVIGRTRNLVSYPNGDQNWPSYNPMQLMQVLPNVQFQLVQKSLDTLLLRIGTSEPLADTVQGELKTIINEAMGFAFNIQFEQLDYIPRNRNGKYEEFLSEVGRA